MILGKQKLKLGDIINIVGLICKLFYVVPIFEFAATNHIVDFFAHHIIKTLVAQSETKDVKLLQ